MEKRSQSQFAELTKTTLAPFPFPRRKKSTLAPFFRTHYLLSESDSRLDASHQPGRRREPRQETGDRFNVRQEKLACSSRWKSAFASPLAVLPFETMGTGYHVPDSLGGPLVSSPAVSDGMLYIGGGDDYLYAYALSGKK